MKKWLKWGLISGFVFTILFFFLVNIGGGFNNVANMEGNILAATLFLPIFPLIIFVLAIFGDMVEEKIINRFLFEIIILIFMFIGYFIWGVVIGFIKETTEKPKNNSKKWAKYLFISGTALILINLFFLIKFGSSRTFMLFGLYLIIAGILILIFNKINKN